MSPKASKGRNKKSEIVPVAVSELPPLRYDPLEASFNALHRAGMVGLALQIEAMRKRNETLPEEDVTPVPHLEWIEDGRGIEVTFTMQSFDAVLQERYLGETLVNDKPAKKKKGKAASDKQEVVKTVLIPRLRYLEVLGADQKLQKDIRSAYLGSFFSIYKERESFFSVTKEKKTLAERINSLWATIASEGAADIQKSSLPNVVGNNLKGTSLHERGKDALLLHFWSLASWFFKPKSLKYDKNEKRIIDAWLPPVIVVPDVSHVQDFFDYIKSTYSRQFEPVISTHLEAALAFYIAPSIAHGQAITREIKSEMNQLVNGASVFVYRPGKQPEVVGVFNETYDDTTLQEYRDLLGRDLKSLPYRALRVENLLAGRVWYDGFNKLVDQWPLELFVPVKERGEDGAYKLREKACELAQDLATDFRYFAEKEDEMEVEIKDAAASVPTLIDELVTNYLNWRVYNKGQNPPDKEEMIEIFKKKKDSLLEEETGTLGRFNQLRSKVVNQEFVDFRGATDKQRFAELFITRLFEADFHTTPEQREMLRPFYEGSQWESGRWLTLMAISAAGAPRRNKKQASWNANEGNSGEESTQGKGSET